MLNILSINPLQDYLMEVKFSNGCILILNLAGKLQTIRFRQLEDKIFFEGAVTDGKRIYWNDFTEVSITEIFEIAKMA